jgi:hypothetical protein
MLLSGVSLEVLELKDVSISKAVVERLVRALEACLSLAELSLDDFFEYTAAFSLARCIRASRALTVCGLRRLCLRNFDLPGICPFASILEPLPSSTTVLPSLRILNLRNTTTRIGGLLDALVMGHRLSSLSLERVTVKCRSQLIVYLPNLLYLNELTVRCWYNFQYQGYKE